MLYTMVFENNHTPWNKGLKKETDERVKKNALEISKSLKGHKHSAKTIEKISQSHMGKILSKEHKQKISEGVKNNPNVIKTQFKKGHVFSEEIRVKQGMPGDKNPAWIDGRSYNKHYLPEFRKIRKTILKRDKNKCKLCPKTNDLAVHHIDYNKKNNKEINLITLCHNHHSQTNHNRDYWQNLLTIK